MVLSQKKVYSLVPVYMLDVNNFDSKKKLDRSKKWIKRANLFY